MKYQTTDVMMNSLLYSNFSQHWHSENVIKCNKMC